MRDGRLRKWRRAAFVAGALVGLYVASYAALYRRGVREADEFGYSYFFYEPCADVVAAQQVTPQHIALRTLYLPLEEQHRRWLGGRESCRKLTCRLSQ